MNQGYISGAQHAVAQANGLDTNGLDIYCVGVVVLGYCGRYSSYRVIDLLLSIVAGIK